MDKAPESWSDVAESFASNLEHGKQIASVIADMDHDDPADLRAKQSELVIHLIWQMTNAAMALTELGLILPHRDGPEADPPLDVKQAMIRAMRNTAAALPAALRVRPGEINIANYEPIVSALVETCSSLVSEFAQEQAETQPRH